MVQLIFKNGPKNGSAIPLRPGLNRIGRNPANDIQIAEPSVSGFHCELHVSPLGVAFRDVGSSNGSFIEGRRVDKAIISSPKTLRLGAIELDVQVPVANVAIPEQKKEPEIFANFMPDGAQACQTHAASPRLSFA
jgi:pSer/pThr/pTyr-binding forkhead associated (FHA) protein